ncbi:MAG: NAD-binding protein [Epsilonproteobacteria bacterium]|nr:NAD-binding protein [Campylobacterota bacterium]
MSNNRIILIFGNNEYAQKIYESVESKCDKAVMFGLQEPDEEQHRVQQFDLSDNWDDLRENYDMQNAIIFCALQNEAQNIFLTLSLHAAFENVDIIALARNQEDANKLYMAGATKVIPIVETTALIIADMIKKPIITNLLHNILYEESSLKLMQIEIHNAEHFEGKYPADINWSRDHGIIVLSVITYDGVSEFIYSSKTKYREIHNGDLFVVIGYEKDLQEFKKFIGEANG